MIWILRGLWAAGLSIVLAMTFGVVSFFANPSVANAQQLPPSGQVQAPWVVVQCAGTVGSNITCTWPNGQVACSSLSVSWCNVWQNLSIYTTSTYGGWVNQSGTANQSAGIIVADNTAATFNPASCLSSPTVPAQCFMLDYANAFPLAGVGQKLERNQVIRNGLVVDLVAPSGSPITLGGGYNIQVRL